MLQEIIRGEFGQHYTFLSANAYSADLSLESKNFWDIEYTRQFVSSLHTTPDYFADLLSQLGQSSGRTEEERVNAVSYALLNRELHVYPVKPLRVGEADLAARTLEQDNIIYQIRHASVVLLTKPQLKRFSSKSEAQDFIQQFGLDKKTMSKLILEADWQSNPAALDENKQTEKLAELILANKLVITQRTAPEPAKPEGAAAAAPASTVGNRSAGLGPEKSDESTPAKPKTFKSQDDAASAALNNANPKSISDNLEYGGLIYRDKKTGEYGYSGPVKGSEDGVDPNVASIPEGTEVVGDYHTHADYSVIDKKTGAAIRTSDPKKDDYNSDNFSPDDIKGITADGKGIDGYKGYLGTPGGKYKVFDPASGNKSLLQK